MKKSAKIILIIVSVLLILGLLDIIGLGVISFYQTVYGDFKLPPCDQLPSSEQVEQVLVDHKQDKERIEETCKYGGIYGSFENKKCPGKAHILVQYSTVSDRACFKKLIGKTFYGMPYSMMNT